ncbi:DUF5107 domain-containing protein [Chitinophaga horti]|uniref:DUF5107 domain-containing protein n=1 Tax=Chitinophaga horti TaxID=2920382 RepID=A0ABY6J591_9BACT|nr:DUF5107 domain-containing protein [Chitinophaga horti]UYQ94849.1 DUF5107 domain-containing protein [Chitinophaga horti]
MDSHVKIWTEAVTIPTYPVGKPDKNPMFLEKRVYQGSSGVVYPHAVIDKIYDEKQDQEYTAVFLENEFLRIMVLPQLGGRIQMAYDKVKERHFIYYNQVIKPALVGLTGPWISGGIEFNWPQHHRPSTFDPVDFTIKQNEDGSATCWVNEVELMFRTKGMVGFTLHPGKAYLEITGKLYNRTPFPQTFLWWANPAVKVNDWYQSIFPPDVYAVFDHGRRDVSSFPIAKGTYYKVDYSPGTDISRYKNIPVPTSYMAVASEYNFIGGYEHDTGGGLLHVADHHISPGKKQWTWGHGDFGQAWDRNLTDEDGPYIELMTGMFTDNQPDFSWIQPFEQKEFVQYFMPYREVGVVKNATKEAAAGLEINGREALIKIHFTAVYNEVAITLRSGKQALHQEETKGSPMQPYITAVTLPVNTNTDTLLLEVRDLSTNTILVAYQAAPLVEKELPPAAAAALKPADVVNNEQLFLTGQHIEQYRHATYDAADYYEEALRRDAGDIRCNTAMGLRLLRKAKPALAEPFLRAAITTATYRNPNPYDGESYYHLGWSLLWQDKTEEAYSAFYKSTWNDAWQHAGFLQLARIASRRRQWSEALAFVEKSLVRNWHSHTARHLKAALLRKTAGEQAAKEWIQASLEIDPFNYGCLFELHCMHDAQALPLLLERSRNWMHTLLEYSIDYVYAGLYEEATELLLTHLRNTNDASPLCYYYLAWISGKQGNTEAAVNYASQGHAASHDYCFPHRVEDALALQYVLEIAPAAPAYYYLGNLWYDKKLSEDAVHCWEQAIALGTGIPTVYRNLSLAMFNKQRNPERALALMEQAFRLNENDARVFMELDQLHKRKNTPTEERYRRLSAHPGLLQQRDDLYLEYVILLNQRSHFAEAATTLDAKRFHPWEGGEGKVTGQYLVSHLELAKLHLADGKPQAALDELEKAAQFPENLGEGKISGTPENDLFYLKGEALALLGNTTGATESWQQAAAGNTQPAQAIFYNDPQPDKIFYRGLASHKLGEQQRAADVFDSLIAFGQQHLNDKIEIDYFAVSLPDLLVFDADLDLKNRIHCLYMTALGYLGHALSGDASYESKAATLFEEVLSKDVNHLGALIHQAWLNRHRLQTIHH